jgi:hypothetical protein
MDEDSNTHARSATRTFQGKTHLLVIKRNNIAMILIQSSARGVEHKYAGVDSKSI